MNTTAEGAAFWIIRTAPARLGDFLWSKFWTGFVPVVVLTETLTIIANEFLGVDPFVKIVAAAAVVFMSLALAGLATGLGARYPRFAADNPQQVAGSYGGVAFMILAVLFVLVMIALVGWPTSVYLFASLRRIPLSLRQQAIVFGCFGSAIGLSIAVWLASMRSGIEALMEMDRTPS
jgi:hypothetical protein